MGSQAAPARRATWAAVVAEASGRSQLTKREREMMALVASGLRSGDMARRLFLSPETVKSHVQNAMGKLGARTRAHAVAIALVSGQIGWEGQPLGLKGARRYPPERRPGVARARTTDG